jgi:two-component system, OmpR family, KDP operon response regulator KdpE
MMVSPSTVNSTSRTHALRGRARRSRRQGTGARILLAENDRALARAIRSRLAARDYRVLVTSSGKEAQSALEQFRPELVVLDLDDAEGAEQDLILWFRKRSSAPIIVLSSRRSERDMVAMFDLGADDYVTKPFGLDELLARLRVALRHVAQPGGGQDAFVRIGELEVDVEHRRVRRHGLSVHLTPTEYDLLKLFLLNPDKLLTDKMLLESVWGPARQPKEHTLHVYVMRLRHKLEPDPSAPTHLLTEMAAGYRLRLQ